MHLLGVPVWISSSLGVGMAFWIVVVVGTVLVSSCTLGVGAMVGIGLSMTALSIVVCLVVCVCAIDLAIGTLLSFGGAVALSKVT